MVVVPLNRILVPDHEPSVNVSSVVMYMKTLAPIWAILNWRTHAHEKPPGRKLFWGINRLKIILDLSKFKSAFGIKYTLTNYL